VASPDEVPQWARPTKLQIYSQEIEQASTQLRFFENLDHQLLWLFLAQAFSQTPSFHPCGSSRGVCKKMNRAQVPVSEKE
jgi:hypothetical protein